MNAAYFQALFGHAYWARDKILEQVAQLTEEEYTRQGLIDYGSVRKTLLHYMSGEANYVARFQGKTVDPPISEETIPTVEGLRDRWKQEEAKTRAFLAQLTDEDLQQRIETVARDGTKYLDTRWWLLAQSLNHSTQHRSEVAVAISQLGHSPGDLDVIRYLRAQSTA